jgi:non-specific serine/threonine protein kinase
MKDLGRNASPLQPQPSSKPISIDESIDITIQIARGLQKAHEKGIVHRDIKPANIMITGAGTAKILDFGLAKLAGQTRLTKTGSTVGTFAYMSPEQARSEEVDHRTDIWSLGVILYEMVSGELPFKGDYDQAVVYSILNEKPDPIDAESSEVFQIIIDKSLEKNPADRYEDFGELINDLERLQAGSSAIPTSTVQEKRKLKSILITTAVMATVVVGYWVIPLDFFEKTSEGESGWENSIAVLPFDDLSPAGDQEWFCDGMTDQILSNLAKLKKLKVRSRKSVMKYKNTNKSVPEIGKELNVAHVLEGSVMKFGDRIRVTAQLIGTKDDYHLWSEDYEREYKELFVLQNEVSEKIARSLLQTLSGEELDVIEHNRPKNLEAWEYFSRGIHIYGKFFGDKNNISFLETAEDMLIKAIKIDPGYVPSYANLSEVYNTYHNFIASTDEEKQKYRDLQEKYVTEGLKIDPNSADLYWAQGGLLIDSGDWRAGFESYMKAIMIDPNHKEANFAIGYHYGSLGLFRQAIGYFTRTIEVDPTYMHAYRVRSMGYDALGNLEQAEKDILKALVLSPDYDENLLRYAKYLILTDRKAEASEILRKMEKIYPNERKMKSWIFALNKDKEKAMQANPDGHIIVYYIFKMVDEAVAFLNKQLKEYKDWEYSIYLEMTNSHLYDFLREDPRFQNIVEEYKKIYDENMEKYGDIDM